MWNIFFFFSFQNQWLYVEHLVDDVGGEDVLSPITYGHIGENEAKKGTVSMNNVKKL